MGYNESLDPNSNYPCMTQSQWDSAPWNQVDVPEKEFEVTCSQSLSRTAIVTTNNYVPGASGCDYEPDGEGGYSACSWQDEDDTSDTNWSKEYEMNNYYTPLQLIQLFKKQCELELKAVEEDIALPEMASEFKHLTSEKRRLKHLIEECDCWTEDETEFSL